MTVSAERKKVVITAKWRDTVEHNIKKGNERKNEYYPKLVRTLRKEKEEAEK